MLSRLPRWLTITIFAVLVAAVITGVVLLILQPGIWRIIGIVIAGVLLAFIVIIAVTQIPPLLKLYRFQKYFKQHEAQMNMLPSLMQEGRTQDALMRFEGVMKHAPENAYFLYLRAFFLQAAGKLPEALSATNKALAFVKRGDPFLALMLQQVGGQMGQPTTVEGFKQQLEELRHSLEPRVTQMRQRREKAAEKRKKKSR